MANKRNILTDEEFRKVEDAVLRSLMADDMDDRPREVHSKTITPILPGYGSQAYRNGDMEFWIDAMRSKFGGEW